jgi:hypothetical protein
MSSLKGAIPILPSSTGRRFAPDPTSLRSIREFYGKSIIDIAKEAETSASYVYMIEQGKRNCPPKIFDIYENMRISLENDDVDSMPKVPDTEIIIDEILTNAMNSKCENPKCTNIASIHSVKIIPNQSYKKSTWGKEIKHLCIECSKKDKEEAT